jgi:hypothetical protein
MPRLLTRGNDVVEIGYRVAGFISERWPGSHRNDGRHHLGTGGRLASESAIVIAVGGGDEPAPPPRLQVVRAHQPADLLAVDDDPLVAQRGADTTIAVGFELVADRACGRRSRPRRPALPARRRKWSGADPSAGILERRRAHGAGDDGCRRVSRSALRFADAPLRNSSFEGPACRPAARARRSELHTPGSGRRRRRPRRRLRPRTSLPHYPDADQQRSCRFAKPCSVSPARNSSATWRLNATLWDRWCLGHGFHSSGSPACPVNSESAICPAPGAHSIRGSTFHAHPQSAPDPRGAHNPAPKPCPSSSSDSREIHGERPDPHALRLRLVAVYG